MSDASAIASRLGVSAEAVALTLDADLIDLHLDTFIAVRLFGYDIEARHPLLLGGRFMRHSDLPRLTDGGVSGGMWSITTNPFRTAAGRARALERNLARLRGLVEATDGAMRIVASAQAYREARADGAHACFLAIQGGNALAEAPEETPLPDADLLRVTLVHLTSSHLGATSSPLRLRPGGLTEAGRQLVRRLDRHRVLVDLAHIHPEGFWDVVDEHDPSLPLVATHTGVSGVTPHWRNLDDRQLEAIADTGGVIGVMLQRSFLSRPGGPSDARMVAEHLDHIVRVVGVDHAALGSDYDGMVVPPVGLEGSDCWPRLVETLIDQGWEEAAIRKVLGGNFLRVLEALRPD